jgi:acyl-CoA reductase-like NAD-dependent aldehyde dehydrogenase
MSLEQLITISPLTNQPILTRNALHDRDLSDVVDNAASAFQEYKSTTLQFRKDVITKALKLLEKKTDDIAKELTEQMGRPIAYTAKEVKTAIARAEYLLKISDDVLADTDGEKEKGFRRFIRKHPVGVVLVIFAWNYPYLILVNSLIPALLAGNSVILKPSPQTPTIVEHMKDIFTEAGLPDGVLQYFHCGSQLQLESVIRNPKVDLICFTGSTAGGLAVQRAAGDRVSVKVGLELGGSDAAYVRDDVDIKWAAEEIVDGAVFNSGQSCCSIERVFVAEKIHDQFVTAVQDVLKGYVLGDPTDSKTHLGPVVSKRAAQKINDLVKDAVDKGAKDVTPDNDTFKNPPKDGNYVAPTILTNVTPDMRVLMEEAFGPIIPIVSVKSDDEAIKFMNNSTFGLTGSIWTKDVETGAKLAEDVEAGTCFVNRCDYPSPVSDNLTRIVYHL